MTDIRLPPIEAVIDLQSEWVRDFGGAQGIRDRGALEGSLGRALQLQAYEPAITIAELAAAVCVSICRNHPFIDGNKRAAFGTLGVILGMNGLYLDVTEAEATRVVLSLAAGEMDEDSFRKWVGANAQAEEC